MGESASPSAEARIRNRIHCGRSQQLEILVYPESARHQIEQCLGSFCCGDSVYESSFEIGDPLLQMRKGRPFGATNSSSSGSPIAAAMVALKSSG